jgi:small basic protein
MTGLLHAEWIKLSKRWVFRVLVLVLLLLSGMTGFIFLILPELVPDAIEGIPILGRRDAIILGIQTVLGQNWFPMILAVVMLGSEVTSSAWGAALTREARRGRLVTAKLGVMSVAAWIATLAVIALWVIGAVFTTEGSSGFTGGDWFGVAWKTGVVQLTWVALGLAAISWVRSTGLAIGLVIAISFVEGILALWAPYRSISLSTATNSLFGEVEADVSGGIGVSVLEAMSFSRALIVVLAWAAVATALAYTGLQMRDA